MRNRAGSLVDGLVAQWWTALDAARASLHSASHQLEARELGAFGTRLDAERAQVAVLLQGLARDLHTESRLLLFLTSPGMQERMLGLPSGVDACVFDLDGVLTTSATVHAAAWTETFDSFLLERAECSGQEYIPFDPHRDYQDHIAGRPRLDGVRAFLASRGISLPEGSPDDEPGLESVNGIARLKNDALQLLLERRGVSAFEASRSYLEGTRMVGLHRAVVSASTNTATILESAGLEHLIEHRVDGITIATRHLLPKPAPDTVLAACGAFELEPDRVVAFETTPAGVAAARAAGVKLVVGVDREGSNEELRASDADIVVRDLAELFDRSS